VLYSQSFHHLQKFQIGHLTFCCLYILFVAEGLARCAVKSEEAAEQQGRACWLDVVLFFKMQGTALQLG
jgi:hypothetical protein